MGIDIRLPNINAKTEAEQQIKSYLIQLAEQLQWALKNIDTSNNTVVVSPTPKSLISSSQTTASAEATFGSIKALIIKSADIVNAYTEEITKKLEGEYVAESDFGTFRQQTSQDIFENATNLNRSFNHIQEIKTGVDSSLGALSGEIGQVGYKVGEVETSLATDIEALKQGFQTLESSVVKVTANIKAGLLSNDGIPVYGFEVGQTNVIDGVEVFNKFARFTADRLSFYDQNGVEVAYISDYRLYIYNVEITGIYKIGGLVDTVLASGDVVEKWVGRS
jgi:hypothetical protein